MSEYAEIDTKVAFPEETAPRASEAAAGLCQGAWEGDQEESCWKNPDDPARIRGLQRLGVLPGDPATEVDLGEDLPDPGDPEEARIRRTVSQEEFWEAVHNHYRFFSTLTEAAIWAHLVGGEDPFSGTTAVNLEEVAAEFGLEPATVGNHIDNLPMVEVRERNGDRLLVRAHPPKELRRRPVVSPAERTGFPPGLRSLLKNPAQIAGEDWSHEYTLRNEHGDVVETATKEHRSHTVAARLLVYLSFRTHAAPGEPCRRSDTAVADSLGVSRPYVCAIRNEIERDGWLVRLPHLRHDGETRAPVTAAEPHTDGDDGVHQQVHQEPEDDGNPVQGLQAPKEKNPLRPVATQDRYEAVLAEAEDVRMEIRWDDERDFRRSYLRELLVIVNGTGRRISSVVELRADDLLLDEGKHGKIRWRPDADKESTASCVPIGPDVREAVVGARRREPVGGCLFPCRDDPDEPITTGLARSWLNKTEEAAGVESQRRGGFHAYRRKWATERKHLPDADVAQAGGWRSVEALRKAYQQADEETMLRVATEAKELREVG